MKAVTVCKDCRRGRAGRHSTACPHCGSKRQLWLNADDFQPTELKPREPIYTESDKWLRLAEEFEEAEKALARENSKRWPDQASINYFESKLAAIEKEFQQSDQPLSLYRR